MRLAFDEVSTRSLSWPPGRSDAPALQRRMTVRRPPRGVIPASLALVAVGLALLVVATASPGAACPAKSSCGRSDALVRRNPHWDAVGDRTRPACPSAPHRRSRRRPRLGATGGQAPTTVCRVHRTGTPPQQCRSWICACARRPSGAFQEVWSAFGSRDVEDGHHTMLSDEHLKGRRRRAISSNCPRGRTPST